MPELPEVETIRQGLRDNILNKKIKSIKVNWSGITKENKVNLKTELVKQKFLSIDRVGKLLIFDVSQQKYLLIHLKMTGQLVYKNKQQLVAGGHKLSEKDLYLPNKHTHLEIYFVDKSILYFNDLRKFGYVKMVDKLAKEKIVKTFGLNPLDKNFNLNQFKSILKDKKTSLKTILLNQHLIAGLGNIYVDEICFKSGVLPNRRVNTLNNLEIKKIYQNIKSILQKAIKYGGMTFRDYLNYDGKQGSFTQFLQVYSREGKKCYFCGEIIKKIKVVGRGTHFCNKCQC